MVQRVEKIVSEMLQNLIKTSITSYKNMLSLKK